MCIRWNLTPNIVTIFPSTGERVRAQEVVEQRTKELLAIDGSLSAYHEEFDEMVANM